MQINAVAARKIGIADKWYKNVIQDDNLHVEDSGEQDKSFDDIMVKYINLDSVKLTIFTKTGVQCRPNINLYSVQSRHRSQW